MNAALIVGTSRVKIKIRIFFLLFNHSLFDIFRNLYN